MCRLIEALKDELKGVMSEMYKNLDKSQINFSWRLLTFIELSSSPGLNVPPFFQISIQISRCWGSLRYFLGRHRAQVVALIGHSSFRDDRVEMLLHLCGIMEPNPDVWGGVQIVLHQRGQE